MNDHGTFEHSYSTIYPTELKLSRTDINGKSADYLDLTIGIEESFFTSMLYDKRHAFSFDVINYPCLTYSNVPSKPAYGIYLSQILRVARNSSKISSFNEAVNKMTIEFLNKGFLACKLGFVFTKFINEYQLDWCHMGTAPEVPSTLYNAPNIN